MEPKNSVVKEAVVVRLPKSWQELAESRDGESYIVTTRPVASTSEAAKEAARRLADYLADTQANS